MAAPSVTWTFSNSTTADATQVNTNFTNLVDGASDSTKDYTINAITAAGAATFNGNVTLGNGTPDDISILGSIATSIPVKTTFSYDLGTSSIGWKSIYFGSNDSAGRTTRIIAGAVSASWTLTLPTAVGAIGKALFTTDAAGATTWRYSDKVVASQTAAYSATGDETFIPCDATSAGFTVTLPAASTHSGKRFTIKKTDSSANVVTVDGNGSETIDGAADVKLLLQYESVTLLCNGTGWHIENWPPISGTYTPTLTGTGNVDATTARLTTYVKTRDMVHVAGGCEIDANSLAATSFTISLPVAPNNFAQTYEAGGCGTHNNGTAPCRIVAVAAAKTVSVAFTANSTSNLILAFQFAYRIV